MYYLVFLFIYMFIDLNYSLSYSNNESFLYGVFLSSIYSLFFNLFVIFKPIYLIFSLLLNSFFLFDVNQLYISVFFYNFNFLLVLLSLLSFLYLAFLFYFLLLSFLYNNNFHKYAIDFLTKFLNKLPCIFILKFLPTSNWYNPFELQQNNLFYNKNINISFSYFYSLSILAKNNFKKSFYVFSYNLLNFFYNLKLSSYFITWKPLFKKTSYFGIYNAFKNKY